jgi:hypothetical protein
VGGRCKATIMITLPKSEPVAYRPTLIYLDLTLTCIRRQRVSNRSA